MEEYRMKKLIVLLSMAGVVAVLVAGLSGAFGTQDAPSVYASSLAGIQGSGETGIQVQNLDASQDAAITAVFYKQDGSAPISIAAATTPPRGSALYYLPSLDQLPDGAYAAVINSDRQIAAIARTDWQASGGAAIYSNVIPGTDVAVPLAVKQYYDQCSLISVQNTDTNAPATAELEVYTSGQATPIVTVPMTIQPGTSVTADFCTDDEFAAIPDGFLGSVRVKSQTELGVQSFIDIESSDKAVYAFEGVPATDAASELFAPLTRRRQPFNPKDLNTMYYDTGISVVNPNASPVQATVTYYGAKGVAECVGQTFTQGPYEIAANSSVVFYQGPAEQPITGMNPLPDDCVASATIVATGGTVLAIVNDSLNYIVESAAYNAVGADGAGEVIAMPLFRSGHTAWNLYTGISAMNVGDGPANIEITAKSSSGYVLEGRPGMTHSNVAQYETALFWPGSFAAGDFTDPAKAVGSATITSNQPVAVIVNDISLAGKADSATYNGINAEQ
jgi:hypothetical protein